MQATFQVNNSQTDRGALLAALKAEGDY